MKIRWGVIGCGGIAYRRTIPGLLLSENSELVALMDTNADAVKAAKAEFGAKYAFTSEDELLALDGIDAVYIATPVFCHAAQVKKAADAKKHILLEKPMGLTANEAVEISEYCKARGVKLGVGLMMRFSSYHTRMKEIVADGLIGDVVSMRAQLTCMYPKMDNCWRQDKALSGGGALMDMGIHCIDLLQYISGDKAESVCGTVNNLTFDYNVEDSATIIMKMQSGASAVVESNFNIPDAAALCRIEIYGTKGSILAQGTIGQTDSGKMMLYSESGEQGYDASQNRESTGFVEVVPECGNMYEKEISAFARAIIDGTDVPIGAEDAIQLQRVVEAAYDAAREGRTVTL